MRTIFLTGYPGYLGSALLPRLVRRAPDSRVVCLVQERYRQHAADRLAADVPEAGDRVQLVTGDIGEPGLGLSGSALDARAVEEVYHLAAIYDLGVPDAVAERVNVEGTRHVLDWAAACPSLARFHHVSTCFVSGRHPGLFRETQLEHGNLFNNAYERTKYLAEVLVWRRMTAGFPGTVYRPAIVVGDSRTGATQKYDGPYFAFQWLLRQPGVAFMPVVGDPDATHLNVVPRDFVLDAIVALSGDPATVGRTYQLADPEALTVAQMLEVVGSLLRKRIVRVPLPRDLARWSLERAPGVQALLRIPPSVVDYFTHPTHYDVRESREALATHGIAPPRFAAYAPALLDYMRRHPDVGSAAMA